MEEEFQKWYALQASQLGLDPNPDNPLHYYDWRAAFQSGAAADAAGHWPSTFKKIGHLNLIVDGRDTRTSEKASPDLAERGALVRAMVGQPPRSMLRPAPSRRISSLIGKRIG